VVATGGLAPIVAAHSETITDVDLDLTLRGIHLSAGGSSRH
jgi:pantothenate kinase type III